MTDLDLQDAIIKEIEKLTENQSLKKLNGEVWKDYNLYRQEKPYKDDEADADDASHDPIDKTVTSESGCGRAYRPCYSK